MVLLKVKVFHDEEAKVVAYTFKPGSNKIVRHLDVVLPNGIEFDIGTGLSEEERRNPPKIGAVVTFK